MTIYDDLQAVAADVLGQFSQGTIQLIKMTPGAGPVENPGPATSVAVTIPGATARGVSLSYVMKGLAQQSDLQVTAQVMAGISATLTDRLSIDGKVYKFRQIIAIPAAGTPVAYTYIVHAGE